ncbi:MAG: UDP-glucose 4-epimerase GalE [Candidatus Methylopumilus sp.]|nr:UDP-glucose 4-epimerase GalE [Candidatus Methylopumilus sp.]
MTKKTILITGGTGYIGSHTAVQLLEADYQVIMLDNLSNSKADVVQRVEKISEKKVSFIQGDIRDEQCLHQVFHNNPIDAVIHFAGLKAVGEGQSQPMRYYENNVSGSLSLFQAMQSFGVKTLLFSSSATVYGDDGVGKYHEQSALSPSNVYGQTKYMVEQILRDIQASDVSWRVGILRYFNPVGAHPSGCIGEDPNGIPNNLMPYIAKVASGELTHLNVFGNDYPTPDGTGLRDYIHIQDLAAGHLESLRFMLEKNTSITVNLGTGQPHSVLELVHAFEQVTEQSVPYQITQRRAGDVAICYADPSLAKTLMGWQAKYNIQQMCADTWRWQTYSKTLHQ